MADDAFDAAEKTVQQGIDFVVDALGRQQDPNTVGNANSVVAFAEQLRVLVDAQQALKRVRGTGY